MADDHWTTGGQQTGPQLGGVNSCRPRDSGGAIAPHDGPGQHWFACSQELEGGSVFHDWPLTRAPNTMAGRIPRSHAPQSRPRCPPRCTSFTRLSPCCTQGRTRVRSHQNIALFRMHRRADCPLSLFLCPLHHSGACLLPVALKSSGRFSFFNRKPRAELSPL